MGTTSYPDAIDPDVADDHARWRSAIRAIQIALGTNPKKTVPQTNGPRVGHKFRPGIGADTQALAAGVYCYYVPCEWPFTMSHFHFSVSANPSSQAAFQPAIWLPTVGGLPGTLLHEGPVQTFTALGDFNVAFAGAIPRGGLYLGGRVTTTGGNPQFYVPSASQITPGFYDGNVSQTTNRQTGYSMAAGSGLPATWEANPTSLRWPGPLVWLTVGAVP